MMSVRKVTVTRTILVVVEWIFALALFSTAASIPGIRAPVTNFAIAWGVIGWLAVSVLLVLALTQYSAESNFPAGMEAAIQLGVAAFIWILGAIVVSAKRISDSKWDAVIALYWVISVLSLVSAMLSAAEAKSFPEDEATEKDIEANGDAGVTPTAEYAA